MSASQLDRELERAIAGSEGNGKVGTGGAQARPRQKGNIGLLVVLLVMAGGIVALVMTSFKDASVYTKKIGELKAQAGQLGSRTVRVEGNLVHGTLQRRDEPCEYRFTLERTKEEKEEAAKANQADNGPEPLLPVHYGKCIVPDTFKDVPGMDLGVVVTGKLASNGSFEAHLIDAKCPSKYEMKERKDRGEKMPPQLPPAADTPAPQTL